MLIERKTTLHTGNEATDRTRSLADQLRPVWTRTEDRRDRRRGIAGARARRRPAVPFRAGV